MTSQLSFISFHGKYDYMVGKKQLNKSSNIWYRGCNQYFNNNNPILNLIKNIIPAQDLEKSGQDLIFFLQFFYPFFTL